MCSFFCSPCHTHPSKSDPSFDLTYDSPALRCPCCAGRAGRLERGPAPLRGEVVLRQPRQHQRAICELGRKHTNAMKQSTDHPVEVLKMTS